MSKPHTCPVCGGSGKVANYPIYGSSTTVVMPDTKPCNACGGTGVVWEPELIPHPDPFWPHRDPILPRPPTFEPYDPVVPLHWPKDFKFPEDIVKKSKEDLIETLEKWIKELKETDSGNGDDLSCPSTNDDNDFCD